MKSIRRYLQNLDNSWRKEWGQADMPFILQIAPHYKQPAGICTKKGISACPHSLRQLIIRFQ